MRLGVATHLVIDDNGLLPLLVGDYLTDLAAGVVSELQPG
jgi:hypothetical protein